MSSRKRLKPIYDILEAGNNKKVVVEIDKLLAKAPTSAIIKETITAEDEEELTVVIAKALKSLALVRLGRLEDADNLFNELLSKNIVEDNALSVMMQYCRETQQVSKIVSFYENAVKKDPENEDLLCSLFYAYARTQEFIKQQQTALKLYRITNRKIYCYWQALSYVIACEENDCVTPQLTEKQKQLNLQLAERIFDKAYNESKMQQSTDGEFVFYINFLVKRGQIKKSLELVESLNAEKKVGILNYKIKNEINLLNKLEDFEKCGKKLEEYLEHESDDWTYLKFYVDICLKLNKNVEDIILFLNKLKKPLLKGPYLAVLDLFQRDISTNENGLCYLNENLKHLISNYHYKPGFYFDMIHFNKLFEKFNLKYQILYQIEDYLNTNISLNLAENASNSLRLDKIRMLPNKLQKIDHVYSYITYWQLYRHFDFHLNLTNSAQILDIIHQLNETYENGLEFGVDLVDTTQQYCDEIIMLKINFKYDLMRFLETKSQKSGLVLSILSDINYALKKSKSNYQLKLYLVNLYSNFGVYGQLQKNFNDMDIKNIQYYSMSYLILYNCLRLGSYENCNDILNLAKHFYMTNLFDITNYMINCYKYGTFDKLFDLYKFMLNVRKSLNLNVCLQEKFLIKNLFNVNETTTATLVASFQASQASIEILAKQFDVYFRDLEVNAYLVDQFDFNLQFNNENLVDHNDRTVLQYWLSDAQAVVNVSNDYKKLLAEQKNLLVYRNFYLKFIHLAMKSSLNQLNDPKQLDKLVENSEKFELSLVFDGLNINESKPANQLLNLKSSYMDISCKQGFIQLKSHLQKSLFVKVFQLKDTFFSNELHNEKNKNLDLSLCELRSFFEGYKVHLNTNLENCCDLLSSNSYLIEYISVACEHFSLQTYLFILSVYCLLPYWQERCSKKKSSKKKKQFYLDYQSSVDKFYEIYEQLCLIHQFTIETLNKLIKSLNNHQTSAAAITSNDDILLKILENQSDYSLSIEIKDSYIAVYQQLLNQFEFKHKQLQQLLQ